MTNRRYGGLSKSERAAKRRQTLIDAGFEVFGTEGYHTSTVRKLCTQAELTTRYFYESFDSTEQLLIACFDQCIERISAHLAKAIFNSSTNAQPQETIGVILNAFFIEMEDRRTARLLTLEVLGVSEYVDRSSSKKLGKLAGQILVLGRTLYPDWNVSDKRGVLLAATVVGALRQAVIHWMLNNYEIERETMVSTTSMLVLGLLKMIEEEQHAQQQNEKSIGQ